MSSITKRQIVELLDQDEKGRISRAMFQAFLDNPNRSVISFPTIIDNTLGLAILIQKAVGMNNLRNINQNITSENFKIGDGVRKVNLELAPFLDDETGEQAAKRLVSEGYVLEGIGELAQFLADNPKMKKYTWVVALSEASRWAEPSGRVLVPYACVDGADRGFHLFWFDYRFSSRDRVLVSRPSK